MYHSAVRQFLSLYPVGASCDQLLFHLKASAIRATAVDVLQSLNVLAGNGEVVTVAGKRWVLSSYIKPTKPSSRETGRAKFGSSLPRQTTLTAVSGYLLAREPEEFKPPEDEIGLGKSGESNSMPELQWRAALAYYAATQRADPRGKVTQYPDRHGESWQLVAVSGHWWKEAVLRFSMSGLPESLREALSRRNESVCSLGYPVSLFNSPAGYEISPALLLSAFWRIEGDSLYIEVQDNSPVVNPDWLKWVASKSAWNSDALFEALFPVGEDPTLDAVASRMRHALAKLGGVVLSPANLAYELALAHDGLRNCAAIFLPVDARFTQGTAADLDAIAEWSEQEYLNSALHRLFSPNVGDNESIAAEASLPLIQLREMTDRQFEAATGALNEALTLIQGPPGTGKSEVIVSLLVSIFMSGRSVLFASKNHQALDEVEIASV